jgi:hypothetical protein
MQDRPILFDQGTPVPLRRHLHPHRVDTATELGWSELTNGDLLDRAEAEGYAVIVTTDQNLRYQQNLETRQISILVLMTTSWPRIRQRVDDVREALETLPAGGYLEVGI